MGSNCGGEFLFELSQVPGSPQVANAGGHVAWITDVFPGEGNFLFGDSAIQQDHGAASILHLLDPDFQIAIFEYAAALAAQGILIHRDHFLVGKDVVDLRLHVTQIVARNQRRSKDGPQAEVGAGFLSGHAAVAHLEHVRIVPMSRSSVTLDSVLQVEDVEHAEVMLVFALPLVANIPGGAPKISAYG